ncbi:hypothetical protein JCM30471_26070 [Desulfuromonas carbonis]|uniref:cytochrome c3 family protein n=1 Tax=Desulfuromonas sp. DDH964 TaxID=1823759 RepID=UPI00078DDAD9|nr:cytochrome c3 family protein [Desulfuromonas sp. DDH964]AMV70800.1 tetraheme cytochrome c [Desulfuromonas sp. DDH964]
MNGKLVAGLIIGTALLFWQIATGPARAIPHLEAAACLKKFAVAEMSEPCWEVCVNCHARTRPIVPLDIYTQGDARVCINCHDNEAMAGGGGNRFLLYKVGGGGGNHPVNVPYTPEISSSLRPDPQGPRLFFNAAGAEPKVQCSTCHNPMGRSPRLLWISNSRSALCIACHDK